MMTENVDDGVCYRSGQSWDVTWTESDNKLGGKNRRCLGVFAKMYVITTTPLSPRATKYSLLIHFGGGVGYKSLGEASQEC